MNGLSSAEAAGQLRQFGANRLAPATQRSVLLQFLAHFRKPLVLLGHGLYPQFHADHRPDQLAV